MTDSDSAREYLRRALAQAGVDWKAASLAAGKSHSYVRKYLQLGTPVWLPEPVRTALVRDYRLDADKMRPPAGIPRPPLPGASSQSQIQRRAKLVKDPALLDLLRLWEHAGHDTRMAILTLLKQSVRDLTEETRGTEVG